MEHRTPATPLLYCLSIAISVGTCFQVACAQNDMVAADASVAELRVISTRHVCDVVGLGAVGSVPYNFPGISASSLAQVPKTPLALPETSLMPGANPQIPLVFGGDMGRPFATGEGKVLYVFNDTFFPPVESATAGGANDDVLASSPGGPWLPNQECISLQIERGQDASQYRALTVDGAPQDGGARLGPGVVPGPGFSTALFNFLFVQIPVQPCSVAAQNCESQFGQPSDVCLPSQAPTTSDQGLCHFGPCGADATSPCAQRLSTNRLAVQQGSTNFATPQLGVHASSDRVIAAFRGHFSTVSFATEIDWASGNGTVWAVGRDSYWGTPELPMSPYLMRIPASDGVLGEPVYFAGFLGTEPVFSADPQSARPIYEESHALNQHTSISFVPELDGGTWLLFYGGHAQPAIRTAVEQFIRPAGDDLFYSRDAGIYARWAKTPWGPWSAPLTIFNPYLPGQGGYCEEMYFADPERKSGFECAADRQDRNRNLNRAPGLGMAGEYGAAIIPGLATQKEDGSSATVRWLLSTWNPYRVIMLSTELSVAMK